MHKIVAWERYAQDCIPRIVPPVIAHRFFVVRRTRAVRSQVAPSGPILEGDRWKLGIPRSQTSRFHHQRAIGPPCRLLNGELIRVPGNTQVQPGLDQQRSDAACFMRRWSHATNRCGFPCAPVMFTSQGLATGRSCAPQGHPLNARAVRSVSAKLRGPRPIAVLRPSPFVIMAG